jgi:hypothetical protein
VISCLSVGRSVHHTIVGLIAQLYHDHILLMYAFSQPAVDYMDATEAAQGREMLSLVCTAFLTVPPFFP